jgi:hypothetical protein
VVNWFRHCLEAHPDTDALSLSVEHPGWQSGLPCQHDRPITYWAVERGGPTTQLRYLAAATPASVRLVQTSCCHFGHCLYQYTVSFTPTENCVVDVFADVWGSTTQNLVVSGPGH